MTRVIVTGSRTWARPGIVHLALVDAFFHHGPLVVVHGACPTGADAAASAWVRKCGAPDYTEERHPADWAQHGRAAGPIRNRAMVEAGADLLLAFPRGESRGTWGCVRLAEAAGIPVRIIHAEATQ